MLDCIKPVSTSVPGHRIPYVYATADNRGATAWTFRRAGRSVALPEFAGGPLSPQYMAALTQSGMSDHAALGVIRKIPNTLAALLNDWTCAGRPHLRYSSTIASTAAFDMSLAHGWIDVRKITAGVVQHIIGVGAGRRTKRHVLWAMASNAERSSSLPQHHTAQLIAATMPRLEREQAARQAAKQRWVAYLDSIGPMPAPWQ
jgi:hypothetical protein